MSVQLGPFDLHGPLGEGGMGMVYKGVHSVQQVPVAIKVVMEEMAREARFQRAFENEVRAAAGLAHPSIVMVFDSGRIDEAASAASGGLFVAGSPYLVMELADKGSLKDVGRQLPWPVLRYILRGLLGALAHAHARGVIHRDIKPSNILLAEHEGGLFPKLSDFGIAHALDLRENSQGTTESSTGTPGYMAPEQLRGRWRDYGPWTDLYALGIMVWEYVCGQRPFTGNFFQLVHAHTRSPLPRFKPTIEVPDGLDEWLGRLLAKSPSERYKRAADAAWALLQLDEAAEDDGPNPALTIDGDTSLLPDFDDTLMNTLVDIRSNAPHLQKPEPHAPAPLDPIPPLPESWRTPESDPVSMKLVGVGLGLYGLRTIPMVDRSEERDVLWGALTQVRARGKARAVVIRGQAGVGKSRLVDWLCRMAHELGAATALKATHSPATGPTEGLPTMISRHLRCMGLSRFETLERLTRTLRSDTDTWEVLALTELIAPAKDEEDRVIRFASPAERHDLIAAFIAREAEHRPVVVWLDDVQWGHDALSFAHHMLAKSASAPVFFIITGGDERAGGQPTAHEALARIEALDCCQSLTLSALAPEDHRALIESLLGLEGELAVEVEARTGGNPLFAVQLVGDWVQRGILEVTERGFSLREGAQATIPDDLHGVWTGHLDRVLEDWDERAQVALELAAVLGEHVDNIEWQQACELAGFDLDPRLLHALFVAHLADPAESGWRFVHGMLRESLLRLAGEAERLKGHHLLCARMLARRRGRATAAEWIRRAQLLVEANADEDALEALMAAADACREEGEYERAFELLAQHDALMQTMELGLADERVIEGWLLKARLYRLQERLDDAADWATRAHFHAQANGWRKAMARALVQQALLAIQLGSLDEASGYLDRALADLDTPDLQHTRATALVTRGGVAIRHGDPRGALHYYAQALEIFDALGLRERCVWVKVHIAYVHTTEEAWGKALDIYDEAMGFYKARHNRPMLAHILNDRGDIHRYTGDLSAAEADYRGSLEINLALGASNTSVAQLNLAQVLNLRSAHAPARTILDEVIERLSRTGQQGLVGIALVYRLPCLAFECDWDTWDTSMMRANESLSSSGMAFPDMAIAAQQAATLAAATSPERALHSLQLARRLWRQLGRQDCLAEIDADLQALQHTVAQSQKP